MSKICSIKISSPNVKYKTSRFVSAAAINCKRLFNCGSPRKAPQPQLPVATQQELKYMMMIIRCSHHAEELVNPKVVPKKDVTDFR
jgi:hypothetical protein